MRTDIVEKSSLEKYINNIVISHETDNQNITSNKYLTICTTENCEKKDILYLDKGVIYKDDHYYKMFNYQALEKLLKDYNITYCSVKFDSMNEKQLETYFTYIKSIDIIYNDKSYTLEYIESYELFSFLSNISLDKLIFDIDEDLNYKIVINFIDDSSILYDDNGEIYYRSDGQSCYKYYIRQKTQKNKLDEFVNQLVLKAELQ